MIAPRLPAFDISPSSLAFTALALPLQRPLAFLHSAAATLICWLAGMGLIGIAMFASPSPRATPLIYLVAEFTLMAGLAGLQSFGVNWSRTAFAWPAPTAIRFWARRRSGLRFFVTRIDPAGFLLRIAIGVPGFLLVFGGIFGLYLVHPALGLAGVYLLPVLPFALLTSLRWPMGISSLVDETPLSLREARALAKGNLWFRVVAFGCVCAPAWWLAATAFFLVPMFWLSAGPIMPLLVIIAIVPCLTLATAWLSAISALLYARLRSSTTASVFD
jgi:hypothetical protein